MKTITVKKSDLIAEMTDALEHAGSTDWDVYVATDGSVSTRHNTFDNSGWFEICDLYYATLENDGLYPGDDGYDYESAAEWIVNEYEWIDELNDFDAATYRPYTIKIKYV